MSSPTGHNRDLNETRSTLAGLTVETKLLRIGWLLSQKYDPDQPREPAGQPGGGRWTSGDPTAAGPLAGGYDPETTGSIGGGSAPSTTQDEIVTADGSRVLSIRIRSNPHAEWDEQHTVTAPDGTRTVFETSGLTQTIRDGESGEILSRSRLTTSGAEPEAFFQSARAPRRPPRELKRLADRILQAATSLFTTEAIRRNRDGTAIFAAPASEYVPGDGFNDRAMWVGAVSQRELDRLCPRNAEIQALAKSTAAEVRALGGYGTEQNFANIVHGIIANKIKSMKDPDLVAEVSYDPETGISVYYSSGQSVRLDVLESVRPSTVCVYDHKMGNAILRAARAVDIITAIQKHYPGMSKYIMIEVLREMTNRHQIEKIYKPIIESDQNIIRINSGLICRKPVRHFICGIFIERTSDSDCCDPWLMITALFLPKINPNFAFGTYIEYLKRPEASSERSWRWSDPVMIADAIAVIETEVLPKLEFYGTPEGYVTLPPREHTVHYEPREDRMLALIAAGDLDAARTIWHEQEPKYRGKTFHPASLPHRWQMQLAVVAEPLLAGDRRALARILHGWEAANVRGTKIEPYWESTAFPLEAGLG